MKANEEKERVYSLLEQEIIFGRLKPRERLVEQELMDSFGVRRHIIRAALDNLEAKKLVIRHANKGAQVREITLEEVEELYCMRELLHRTAAEQTPFPISIDKMDQLKSIQSSHDEAAKNNNASEAYRINEIFHSTLNEACENQVLAEALSTYNQQTNLVRSVKYGSKELIQRSASEHHGILTALEQSNREQFIEMTLRHILSAKHIYLQKLNGKPV